MSPPEQPDDALTAVTRRPAPSVSHATAAWLAIALGLALLIGPGAVYFGYQRVRAEREAELNALRIEISVGYRANARAGRAAAAVADDHEARLQQLEHDGRECDGRLSLPAPPAATPLFPPPPPTIFDALRTVP